MAAAGVVAIKGVQAEQKPVAPKSAEEKAVYAAPEFYRGIYLTNPSGKNIETLRKFIESAKKANINVMVIDAQPAPSGKTSIPKENIDLVLANGIHPIARVVCFDGGLKQFPIEESILKTRLQLLNLHARSVLKKCSLTTYASMMTDSLQRFQSRKSMTLLKAFFPVQSLNSSLSM